MGVRDRTRPTNTIYRSTRALLNPNSHYAHAQDHHRTLLLFLQSYNPSHRPKSPILISILITLGTSNRVSAAARREQSHRRTGCSPRKRETGTHSDQSTHTIQSGATAVKSLLCNSPRAGERKRRIGVTFERAQMYGETHESVSLDL